MPPPLILPSLVLAKSQDRGWGVFAGGPISRGTTIELSPVLVMSAEARSLLDQTLLHDYIFEWGRYKEQCCLALGYISIYNHSYFSNCEYEMDYMEQTIAIKTVQDIQAGEELLINYNGDWNNPKKLWFEVK